MAQLICVLLTLLLSSFRVLAELINPMQHELQLANENTFTMKVKVARQNVSVAVFFYTPKDKQIRNVINDELDVVAKELKGIFTIVAVNCAEPSMKSHCKAELGNNPQTPILRIYPKLPLPAFNFNGKLVKDEVKKALVRNVSSNVVVIQPSMLPEFLGRFETMPKVLLFSDKPSPSYIYKALSNAFDRKLMLGYVEIGKHADLKQQYKVKNVPHLIVIKPNDVIEVYNDQFEYMKMFEWLNVYAETFLLGSSNKDTEAKPWKFDPIPQLNIQSHLDICFKSQGYCIIYLVDGELSSDDKLMLMRLSDRYKSELKNARWMWMDVSVEREFANLFDLDLYPSMVIINPKGRVRQFLYKDDLPITENKIVKFVEDLLGGNGRFSVIGELPKFALSNKLHEEL